jgi:hypothetical protein
MGGYGHLIVFVEERATYGQELLQSEQIFLEKRAVFVDKVGYYRAHGNTLCLVLGTRHGMCAGIYEFICTKTGCCKLLEVMLEL